MFGFFTKKEKVIEPKIQEDILGPFRPIVDVSTTFSYVKVKQDGDTISIGLNTDTIEESKWALEEVKLLKSAIQNIKKEVKSDMTALRQSYQNNVANRGAMVPGGGKFGMVIRYGIRAGRASERASISDKLKAVQDTVISPLDNLLLHCDKMKVVLKKEVLAG
jgi:hypothetical protein